MARLQAGLTRAVEPDDAAAVRNFLVGLLNALLQNRIGPTSHIWLFGTSLACVGYCRVTVG